MKNINKRKSYRTTQTRNLVAGYLIEECNEMSNALALSVDENGKRIFNINYDYYIKHAYLVIKDIILEDKVKVIRDEKTEQLTLF